jgi:hypothetical protein
MRIDFAPPGLRRALFRTPRATWILFWAALTLGVSLYSSLVGYQRALHDHERRLARIDARADAPPPAPAAPVHPPLPEAQATAVNAAVMQLNLPWRALRDAVQAATPPTVALLALEPDAKRHSLRITAETRSSADMIAYVGELKRQDWFDAVTLARHEINDQDPNKPIRFQIDCLWGSTQ